MLVVPGEVITRDSGLLRGHGTFSAASSLVSSSAGVVERRDKLVSVRPVKGRYTGAVGDIVVGRVSEVGSKKWKVDINSQKDALLHLSGVNLVGGEQRMRSYEDQLQMRTFFVEGDLVSAEVQSMQSDGSASLHTRSLKYGKLENGQLYVAPAYLIARQKQHCVTLDCGVELILGNNGFIWITRARAEALGAEAEAEVFEAEHKHHATTAVLPDERLKIVRVRNAIAALHIAGAMISPESIMGLYARSKRAGLHPKALLDLLVIDGLLELTSAGAAAEEDEDEMED